jgi:hypothetical protein
MNRMLKAKGVTPRMRTASGYVEVLTAAAGA